MLPTLILLCIWDESQRERGRDNIAFPSQISSDFAFIVTSLNLYHILLDPELQPVTGNLLCLLKVNNNTQSYSNFGTLSSDFLLCLLLCIYTQHIQDLELVTN